MLKLASLLVGSLNLNLCLSHKHIQTTVVQVASFKIGLFFLFSQFGIDALCEMANKLCHVDLLRFLVADERHKTGRLQDGDPIGFSLDCRPNDSSCLLVLPE